MFSARLLFSAAFVLIAGGCQMTTADLVKQGKPIEKFYPVKKGVTADSYENDWLNCKIEAAQRVPQNMSIGTTPVYRSPVQTQCYSTGYGGARCTQTGGQTYGGNTYSYDANAELRLEAQNQCLTQSGYRSTLIPKCSPDAKIREVGNKLPPLSAGTCYVADENGSYAITEQTK
jgi:hypothetical protein